ncbi:DUF305 domain-containing protein [Aeromicrobium erythreum]|uniref:DUF305 domain-containing protein n=1 Tax=Aeromicrobium erythreum TaxID=2041 RepID=A0A0U3TLF1_9ACTN|nr:DUF305 domain-containing protein [Aeromicrobium erythreum]ALX06263.1 hypothetical protein AERYTH_16940 [Aeromicrobium erythreum]
MSPRHVLLTLASALLLAGCGSPNTSDEGHDGADVTFAQQMIPHHEQAVEMSDLALEPARGASAEVTDLATRIRAAQKPEIEELTGFLEGWGEDVPSGHGGHEGHGGAGHSMTGMMSEDQLSRLADSDGATFDRLWLELMVEHHEGAVEMARTELADGQDSRAKALARAIIDAQTAEITQMKGLLG